MTRRRWRGPVTILIAVLIVIAAAWLFSGEPSRGSGLSTYHSGPAGGKALHDSFAAAGRKVSRLRVDANDANLNRLAPGSALFVMGSDEPWTGDEASAVERFVEEGGTVVMAFDRRGAVRGLSGQLAPGVRGGSIPFGQPLLPARVAPQSRGWQQTAPASAVLVFPEQSGFVATATNADGTGVGVLALGRGTVVIVADGGLLTGPSLRQADTMAFALALAPGPVVFDEYHHGFRDTVTSGEVGGRVTFVALQMLVAIVAVFFWRGRRRAPAREETEESLPFTRADFAVAMADRLRAADGREVALGVLRIRLRRSVRAFTLAPADADDVELVRRARDAGVDVSEALLARAGDESAFLLRSRQIAEAMEHLGTTAAKQ